MRDHLIQVTAGLPAGERMQAAREYVQVYVLRLVHEQGLARQLSFLGGTALRLLHGLPRFSEDLDFSLQPRPGAADDPMERIAGRLTESLARAGYSASARTRTARNVSSTMIRLDGLPHDVGWSRDPRIALKVKIDVDIAPPAGAVVVTTLIQRFFPIAIRHHDLPSMLAGKIHALLARPYPKGRDWYDLVWYLTEKRGLEPNVVLLGNALEQTGHDPAMARGWRAEVAARLGTLDWPSVIRDMTPFLERPSDADHLRRDLVRDLLAR